jgi:hypothetical protein
VRPELAFLQPLNETRVAYVGRRVEIRYCTQSNHLVDLGKVGILPVLSHTLFIGLLEARIVDSTLEINALIWIEELIKVFVDNCRDTGSQSHTTFVCVRDV